jgi:hypothetical protein
MINNHLKNLGLTIALIVLSFAAYAGSPPTADFSVSPSDVVVPGTQVCFTDQSAAGGLGPNLVDWTWNFAGQAPAHFTTDAAYADTCVTFNNVGTHNICLTVHNDEAAPDNVDTHCSDIIVADPYNIQTENGNTLNGICKYWLFDDGGYGNYGNNQDEVVTICSGTTDMMSAAFSLIDLVAGDFIEIYEGSTTAGSPISTLTSANNGTTPTIFASETCITVRFVTNGSGTAQGFLMQAVCHNNIYQNSAFDGESFTQCSGTIFDSGGASGNYDNNENSVVTICAPSATDVTQILFQNLWLAAGDQLNFYDGSSTGGSLIYTADNSDNGNNSFIFPGLTVSGISQCMTIEFISNGSGTNSGWTGNFNCVTPPTPCNANPVAADNFEAATMICDFSQYCGTTSAFYGVDMGPIGQTAVFDGSLENNSWLMFTADSSSASFNVATASASCYIQIGIYAVDANENFTWLSPASINGGFDYTNVDEGFAGSGVLNAQGMTPGETYYIMIDGHGGSVCDYTLTAGIGVQLPEPQASPDVTMCLGDPETITVTDLNGSTNVDWEWTWNGGANVQQGSSIDLSGFAPGTYTFDVTAENYTECVSTALDDQVLVTINPCGALPVELANLNVDCEETFRTISWVTLSENNNSHFEVQRKTENGTFETIETVLGAGNSDMVNNYSIKDTKRIEGMIYYRLVQVDFDGVEAVSDAISTSGCFEADFIVHNMYYDRSGDQIVVQVSSDKSTEVVLQLTDIQGRAYYNVHRMVEEGNSSLRIDASALQNTTMYIMNVTSETTRDAKRMIIAR